MIKQYLTYLRHSLDQMEENLTDLDIQKTVNLILQSEQKGGRIHLTGIGKPSYVARYIAALMSSTATPAYFLDTTEALHGSSGQVNPNDVVIAISNSGETQELLKLIDALKERKIPLVGVSGNMNSTLAIKSDVFLWAKAQQEGDVLNKPPRCSVIVEMVALQLVSLYLQKQKGVTLDQYFVWHPLGKIGESIREQINGD